MVKIFTTKYQFLGRILLTLLLAVVSCVNAWAEDHEYKSDVSIGVGEVVEYDNVVINPGVTVTVKGELKIAGNVTNNGILKIEKGGKVSVDGDFYNATVIGETNINDGSWQNGETSTFYSKDNNYKRDGSNWSDYREDVITQSATTEQIVTNASVEVTNGSLLVNGTINNLGTIKVKTDDAQSIARITAGSFINVSAESYTYTRTKTQKYKRKSFNWSENGAPEYDSKNGTKVSTTASSTNSGKITLDNGYLVVNGDATLEDKTTINFNQTKTGLKGVVDGEQVAIEPTLLVRGNATIQDDAEIVLQSKKAGSLIVAKTFTDNATSDNQYPWSFEYQEGDTEDAIKIKVKPNNGFSFLYGKYIGKNFDDTEEIADVVDVVKDLLEEIAELETMEKFYEEYPEYKTNNPQKTIDALKRIGPGVKLAIAFFLGVDIDELVEYLEKNSAISYYELENTIKSKEEELERIIENFDIDVEAIAKSKIDNEINIVTSLLPITLNYFVANQDGEEVVFEWQTSSEVNNDFFTIEYSIDGIHFKELLREDGNGTTSVTNDYYATASAEEFAGITYLRISALNKQTSTENIHIPM